MDDVLPASRRPIVVRALDVDVERSSRRSGKAGGDVAVACSRPTLTRLLHTTGFDRIVPVTETVEAAATALATAGESS